MQNNQFWRGVNLGGWLVLEKWISPSLFEGMSAADELSFRSELGERAAGVLRRHRNTFIAEDDFHWLAEHGLNAIRIPVGYWIFYDGLEYLDWSMEMAEKYDLDVLIDLHAAPGSQNGWDHSGRAGKIEWHVGEGNISSTLEVLEKLAQRYGRYPRLIGIELLNEPHWDVPYRILRDFYTQASVRMRPHMGEGSELIISEAFNARKWQKAGFWLDIHRYLCFDPKDIELNFPGHLRKVRDWQREIEHLNRLTTVLVGEWSLGLDPRTYENMLAVEIDEAKRAYATAQLIAFSKARGWFFWAYKTENMPEWNLREVIERGWLKLTPN